MMAVADADPFWNERRKKNPKMGEMSQAAFLLKAQSWDLGWRCLGETARSATLLLGQDLGRVVSGAGESYGAAEFAVVSEWKGKNPLWEGYREAWVWI
jgi:hypothetical protein